ncbi:hypothetical protein DL767_008343 [Monosporascus sp. MG133]|nr:hypothetical protein DL767_008343 [Monosporascus sp. MG133]
MNGTWEEAKTLHFRLTECADQTSVQVFVSWLYEAYCKVKDVDWFHLTYFDFDKTLNHWHLADCLQASELQDFLAGLTEVWFTEGIAWKNENEEGG